MRSLSLYAFLMIGFLFLAADPAIASATTTPPSACGPGKALYKDVKAKLLASGINITANDNDCVAYRPVDTALFSGGCENETVAKEFLKTRTGNKASIDGLNPEFACKLMKLIKEAPGTIGISVGTYQVTASVATHGREYCLRFQCKEGTNTHPLGCAADLLYQGVKIRSPQACQADASCAFAHQQAETRGMQFRLMPGHPRFPGFTEPWHIELKDGDLTRCQGGQVTPTLPPNTTPGVTSPTSAATNALRNFLNPQPPQPQPALPAQPLTTAQSPTSAFSLPTPVSETITQSSTGVAASSSIADRLEGLTRGTETAAENTTASSVPLVVSAADARTLTSTQKSVNTGGTYTDGSPIQQTFVSHDLAWQSNGQEASKWQKLESLRILLTAMLKAVAPFRGRLHDPLENQ